MTTPDNDEVRLRFWNLELGAKGKLATIPIAWACAIFLVLYAIYLFQ